MDLESRALGVGYGVVVLGLGLGFPLPLDDVNALDEDEDASRVESLDSSLVRRSQNSSNLGIVNLSPIAFFVERNVEANT